MKKIEVIAPSGAFPASQIEPIRHYLLQKGYEALIPETILGPDLLSAQSDAERFSQLHTALYREETDLIWCVRGGYGATRLLPALRKLPQPTKKKTLIGFSDITALHLFLSQSWHWPVLHGPSLRQMIDDSLSPLSHILTEMLIFDPQPTPLSYPLIAMNEAASRNSTIHAPLTGGNLALVTASLGTPFQIKTEHRILMLEDVHEPAYRIDRLLTHCHQAGILDAVQAVILGDFTASAPEPHSLIDATLARFAEAASFPVFRMNLFGHGQDNHPWFYAPALISQHQLTQSCPER